MELKFPKEKETIIPKRIKYPLYKGPRGARYRRGMSHVDGLFLVPINSKSRAKNPLKLVKWEDLDKKYSGYGTPIL